MGVPRLLVAATAAVARGGGSPSTPALRATRAMAVAVACAGGAWFLYRRLRGRDRSKTALSDSACAAAEPTECPRLKRCVDAALSLHSLPLRLWAADEALEVAYAEHLPKGFALGPGHGGWSGKDVRCLRALVPPGRRRALAVLLAVVVLVTAIIVLAVLVAILESSVDQLGLDVHLILIGAASSLGICIGRQVQQSWRSRRAKLGALRTTICRATVRVPASAGPGVWRALADGAPAAPASAEAARLRGVARRGALSVCVEAGSAEAAAPMTTYVLEPCGCASPDSGDTEGVVAVHAYVVAAVPMTPRRAAAMATAKIHALLGRGGSEALPATA